MLVVGHEDGVVRTYELPSVGSQSSCPKVVTAGYYIDILIISSVVSIVSRSLSVFFKKNTTASF